MASLDVNSIKEVLDLSQIIDYALQERLQSVVSTAGEISFSILDNSGALISQSADFDGHLHQLFMKSKIFRGAMIKRLKKIKSEKKARHKFTEKDLLFFIYPLYMEKVIIGCLIAGPKFTRKPSAENIESLAQKYGILPGLLQKAIDDTKKSTKEQIHIGESLVGVTADIANRFCHERIRADRNIATVGSLYNIGMALTSTLKIEDLLQTVLDNAILLLEAEKGSLMLLDDSGEYLSIAVAYGLSDEIIKNTRTKLGEGIAGKVAQEGKPRLLEKGVKVQDSKTERKVEELPSAISVPLISKNRVVGVININGRKDGGNFTAEHVTMLTVMGAQAAVAIENAKLYSWLTRKVDELSFLLEISNDLNSVLDRRVVFKKILTRAMALMDANTGSLMLMDPDTFELYIEVAVGLPEEIIRNTHLKLGEGIAGKVAMEKKPRLMKKGVRVQESKTERKVEELKSAISVPLLVMDKVLGVLNISEKVDNDNFNQDDMELLVLLANQAAVAVENTQLHQNIQELFVGSIRALANAIDARDPYTRGHSERVTQYSIKIAEALKLDRMELEYIRYAGLLHDIGKIRIRDDILLKPGKFTDDEFMVMCKHPVYGVGIMEPVKAFQRILPYMYHHHERYGKGGYPEGLGGNEIPLASRILAVADAFDAMTSDRPYRKALPVEVALEEIRKNIGTQFDPIIADIFIKLFETGELTCNLEEFKLPIQKLDNQFNYNG